METETLLPPAVEHGISLEEAITEYVRIQNRYAELAELEKHVKDVLVPAAIEARTDKKTCRVANHNRSIVLKAEFYSYFKCNTKALDVVKEMIGDDEFERLFRIKYEPVSSELGPFLATKTTDESIETVKELIKQAITRSPETPRFSIEKS
jgi:hypothetical protein